MSRPARHARGFALLEVVVALAIMAFSFGALYRALGGSVRAVGDTSRYARSIFIAESILLALDPLPAGGLSESGASDGFRWSVTTTPYDSTKGSSVTLDRVQVDVVWVDGQRERRYSLVSLLPERAANVPGSSP